MARTSSNKKSTSTQEDTATDTYSSANVATYTGIKGKNGEGKFEFEFGGPLGALALILWSHYILFYFWYCLETNNGQMIIPTSCDNLLNHIENAKMLVLTKGIPTPTVVVPYLLFFFCQLLLAAVVPGITVYGLPTAPDGKRLPYHCNGYLSFIISLGIFFLAGYYDLLPLTFMAESYGEVLVTSIIIADATSLFWYFYGLMLADEYTGKGNLSGYPIYDFFMGTILYPRIGEIDIKMIAETRWSWTTLIYLTMSCAASQYKETGRISINMVIMLIAHGLYSNACAKGEHCIPCTWDMFHENYGWMLNFWNIAGVPYLYTYQSLYILRNQDMIDNFVYPLWFAIIVIVILLTAYYIFDTANSQKANVKIRVKRNTYPQFKWGVLEDPIKMIETPHGNILIDGWYAYARKMQYTGDILMALCWGLACGFKSSLPYFYFLFFTSMIIHRQMRDEARCSKKYGEYWQEYIDTVPNVFVPSSDFFVMLLRKLTGQEESEDVSEQTPDLTVRGVAITPPSSTVEATPASKPRGRPRARKMEDNIGSAKKEKERSRSRSKSRTRGRASSASKRERKTPVKYE